MNLSEFLKSVLIWRNAPCVSKNSPPGFPFLSNPQFLAPVAWNWSPYRDRSPLLLSHNWGRDLKIHESFRIFEIGAHLAKCAIRFRKLSPRFSVPVKSLPPVSSSVPVFFVWEGGRIPVWAHAISSDDVGSKSLLVGMDIQRSTPILR